MKRGFLTTSKAKKQLDEPSQNKLKPDQSIVPHDNTLASQQKELFLSNATSEAMRLSEKWRSRMVLGEDGNPKPDDPAVLGLEAELKNMITRLKQGVVLDEGGKTIAKLTTPGLTSELEQQFNRLSHGVVPEAGVPKDYQDKPYIVLDGDKKEYPPDTIIHTVLPAPARNNQLSATNVVPSVECLFTGHIKRAILETPGFPSLPLSPIGGKAHKIAEAGDGKGLGMFATRLIRAGELVLDERPMMLTHGTYKFILGIGNFTIEQQKQIMLYEQGKAVEAVFKRMPVEHQEAFMKLHNAHKHDGSGELVGRIRTNGISTTGPENRDVLRDKGTTGPVGLHSALCNEISYINHCCNPNTVYHWHTDTLSVRVYAVRDIPPGTEITISYGDTLASAAERAKYLAPYGIRSCACGPSCSDPARAKISEKRRESLRKPLTLFPPPEPTSPRDKWIQPAVKRVQELEEEGLQAPELYKRTLHLLVNAYTHLQDVDKALFYAKKLKPVYKAREGVDLPAMYLSKSGLKSSPGYMAATMQKNFKLPPGAPPMLMTAFS